MTLRLSNDVIIIRVLTKIHLRKIVIIRVLPKKFLWNFAIFIAIVLMFYAVVWLHN